MAYQSPPPAYGLPVTPPPVYGLPGLQDLSPSPHRRQRFPRRRDDDNMFGHAPDIAEEEANGFEEIELNEVGAGTGLGINLGIEPPAYAYASGSRNAGARNILYPPVPERARNKIRKNKRRSRPWYKRYHWSRVVMWSVVAIFAITITTWTIVYLVHAGRKSRGNHSAGSDPSGAPSTESISTKTSEAQMFRILPSPHPGDPPPRDTGTKAKYKGRFSTTDAFGILRYPHVEDMKATLKRGTSTTETVSIQPYPHLQDTKTKRRPQHSGPIPLPAWIVKKRSEENTLKLRCEDTSALGRYTCVLNSLLPVLPASKIQKFFLPVTEALLTVESLLKHGLTALDKADGWNAEPDRVLEIRYEKALILVQDTHQSLQMVLEKKGATLDWHALERVISDVQAGRPLPFQELMGLSARSVGSLAAEVITAISKLGEVVKWKGELEGIIAKRYAAENGFKNKAWERKRLDALSGRYATKKAEKVIRAAKAWVEGSNKREDCELEHVENLHKAVGDVLAFLKGEEGKVRGVLKLTKKEKVMYARKGGDVKREVNGLWDLHRAIREEFGVGNAVKERVEGWKVGDNICKEGE